MTSDELNAAIRDLEDQDVPFFESFGGKCVPYIGWHWRDVDFDRDECRFGVIPAEMLVGFMENNMWGYPYIRVDGQEWQDIKTLLWYAVETEDLAAFEILNTKIQGLADRFTS